MTTSFPSKKTTFLATTLLACVAATPLFAQRGVTNLGHGKAGSRGIPKTTTTAARIGRPLHMTVSGAPPNTVALVVVGVRRIDFQIFGGTLVPRPDITLTVVTDRAGAASAAIPIPANDKFAGASLYTQVLVLDRTASHSFAFSRALRCVLVKMGMSDFNGDEHCDLAVGVPGEDLGNLRDAGAVNVLYGGSTLLSASGNQLWHQDTAAVLQMAEAGDRFGAAVATGDFDGDGFSDLAIGAPGENLASVADAGVVHVLYGTAGGLTAARNQVWSQDSYGIGGTSDPDDRWGAALATGDFNHDGFDDLAIGVPGENFGTVDSAGEVRILLGSPTGLTHVGDQALRQKAPLADTPETNDQFGAVLAAGDFDNDKHDDLAIGVPNENAGAGVVHIVMGGAMGLNHFDNQIWHQDTSGVAGVSLLGDRFGYALAAADFDGDGRDDLAIGVPFNRDSPFALMTGAVNVLRGSSAGLTAAGDQYWHQDVAGLPGTRQSGDLFGASLIAADFNEDGHADLAIGIPGEPIGTVQNAGAVQTVRGSSTGLTLDLSWSYWHQNTVGVLGGAETGDAFGSTLGAGDFNGDGRVDLAVGVPGESYGSIEDAGAVHILKGSFASSSVSVLSVLNNQLWFQGSPGIADASEQGDRFGSALTR